MELKEKKKLSPLEVFRREILQRDNILKNGVIRVSFNDKKYTLDERNFERKKNGVKDGK